MKEINAKYLCQYPFNNVSVYKGSDGNYYGIQTVANKREEYQVIYFLGKKKFGELIFAPEITLIINNKLTTKKLVQKKLFDGFTGVYYFTSKSQYGIKPKLKEK